MKSASSLCMCLSSLLIVCQIVQDTAGHIHIVSKQEKW